jgi:hypothetical protein
MSVISIDKFRGLYLRRDPAKVPRGYLTVADNFVVNDGSMQNRAGITTLISDAGWEAIYMARPIDVSDNTKWFVLAVNAGALKLYYCASGINTVILNPVPTGSFEFQFVRINSTYFITFDDSQNGISGANSYVYNPAIHSVARVSGKSAPASAITVTVAGGADAKGVPVGRHVWGVAFETDTGHISAVILAGLVSAVHAGGQFADLSNIPTGAANTGTSKRRILVSKVIPNFDGNLLNYELFFLPTGTIADNTTTVLNNVSFYDTELLDSADYLKDLSSSSAAYSSICQYGERFIGCGKALAGTGSASPHVADVSDKGKPESLDSTDGFITVEPGFGTALQHCVEWKGYLVLIKDIGTYITKDNGDEPNTWPVDKVDGSFGCGPQGVCRIYAGQAGVIEDSLLILTTSGLKIFNGSYKQEPLTKLIDGYYEDLINASTYAEFRVWQVYADPINNYIYIYARLSNSSVVILVGDYRFGLNPDTMIWTKFKFFHAGSENSYVSCISTIPYTNQQGGGGIIIGGETTKIYRIRTTFAPEDDATIFDWDCTTGDYITFSDRLTKDKLTMARVLIRPISAAVTARVYMGDMIWPSYPVYQNVFLQDPTATNIPLNVLQFSINQEAIRGQFSIKSAASTDVNVRAYLNYIKQIVIYGSEKETAKPL